MDFSFLTTLTGVMSTLTLSLFIVSIIIKRNDIADVAWGPGIALVAITSFLLTTNPSFTQSVVTTLICVWALRLGIRVGLKNVRKPGEDPRYKRWRDSWGKWFYIRSFFQVFVLQVGLMIVLGYGAIHLSLFGSNDTWWFIAAGTCIWIFGFLFESVSDWQLDHFITNPANKGKLMRYGLWKYSRHPNYFGEVTMWWGLWIMIIPTPFSLLALISPVTITLLILFVSGIPLLEAMFKDHPEFAEYKRTTNVFVPWWPKK